MAVRYNQKIKLLYVMSILLDKTDEEHGISMSGILEELSHYGVNAERKSIYDDIEALRSYGMEIAYIKGRPGTYQVVNREFELPELKLLVDAVQASRFITRERSGELIQKLEKLSSSYVAARLQRQVFVAERVKTNNTSVYYSVDAIHEGISGDRGITFVYMEWSIKKELVPRRGGKRYRVSPWSLVWMDENYYLVGFDEEKKQIRHYRVDKMKQVEVTQEKRKGKEVFAEVDLARYSKRHFGMYHGEENKVHIRFANHLVGAMIDRFGCEVPIRECRDGYSIATVDVALSPQFYGWLFGLGEDAQIQSPKAAVEGMKAHIARVASNYK